MRQERRADILYYHSMLLRTLATRREETDPIAVRYDAERSVSQVFENEAWVDSWESSELPRTKKADVETGEDQKGR